MASPTWADQGSVLPDPTGAVRRQRSHDSPPGAKIATIQPTGGLYDQDKTAYALPPRTMATSVTMVPSVFDGRKARAGPTLAVPLTKAAAHPAPPRNTAPPPMSGRRFGYPTELPPGMAGPYWHGRTGPAALLAPARPP